MANKMNMNDIDKLIKEIEKVQKIKLRGGNLFDNQDDEYNELDMDNDQDDAPIYQIEEPVKTNLPNKFKTKKAKSPSTWKRLEEIIQDVNENNLGGRSSNYIGGQLNRDFYIQDPNTGLTYQTSKADGYGKEEQVAQKGGCLPARKRKKRSDTGKTKNSEWITLVKAVRDYENIPYNKALTMAKEYRNKGVDSKTVLRWIAEEK